MISILIERLHLQLGDEIPIQMRAPYESYSTERLQRKTEDNDNTKEGVDNRSSPSVHDNKKATIDELGLLIEEAMRGVGSGELHVLAASLKERESVLSYPLCEYG